MPRSQLIESNSWSGRVTYGRDVWRCNGCERQATVVAVDIVTFRNGDSATASYRGRIEPASRRLAGHHHVVGKD